MVSGASSLPTTFLGTAMQANLRNGRGQVVVSITTPCKQCFLLLGCTSPLGRLLSSMCSLLEGHRPACLDDRAFSATLLIFNVFCFIRMRPGSENSRPPVRLIRRPLKRAPQAKGKSGDKLQNKNGYDFCAFEGHAKCMGTSR